MEQENVVEARKGIPVIIEGRTGWVTEVLSSYNDSLLCFGEARKSHFIVVVEFEAPLEDRLSVGLMISAKRYSKEEFVSVVERELIGWLKVERHLGLLRQQKEKEKEELNALVKQVTTDLGLTPKAG